MPLVRPFRAHFYRHKPGQDLTPVVAPPYDVISPAERAMLIARDPDNVVTLELPEGTSDPGTPDNRYDIARDTWRRLHESGAVVQDHAPAFYVLEQSWEHAGRPRKRHALVAAVELHPFSDGIILPHERTLPKALTDRLELTRATAANLSQVFGLYSDPAGEMDDIFDDAISTEALFHATDAEGVVSRVWAIKDPATLAQVTATLADRTVYIADGHHRYTTALAYRDERRAVAGDAAPAEPAYDFVMMALVNMDDPDLVVLPTHRVARADGPFDADAFWTGLAAVFDLTEPGPGHPARALDRPDRMTLLVRTADGTTRIARLKPGVDPVTAIASEHSADWKRLDVTIVQELILRPLLGIHPDEPATLERLRFVKDAHEALRCEDADVALLLAPTRMEQLRAVASHGEIMPQKSTYFYPKLLSGLLLRSLD